MRAPLVVFYSLALLALPPVAAGAQPAPARFESFELPSSLVDTSTVGGELENGRTVPKVNVLLPAGYDEHPRRRYPVLWLLHGANGGTDTWLPSIADLAAGLPAILVMPDGGVFGMYTDWWNDGARGNPAWIPYHLELLRETIESRYRIRPERRWHAIAGISMGGQGALRYAALLPGYFGSVAGFSAALPDMQAEIAQAGLSIAIAASGRDITYETIFGPAADPWVEGHSAQALARNYRHTRVFLTSGDGTNCPEDPEGPNVAFEAITERGINSQQVPFAVAARAAGAKVTETTTCGVHTFGVWDRAFAAARAWGFFKPVPRRPRQWSYRTIATEGEMWDLRFRFDEPPPAVVEFTRSDRALAATGEGRVLIHGRPGCWVSVDLPFEIELPPACRDEKTAKSPR
jgi:S-formylglutathione hydrolase FrmB